MERGECGVTNSVTVCGLDVIIRCLRKEFIVHAGLVLESCGRSLFPSPRPAREDEILGFLLLRLGLGKKVGKSTFWISLEGDVNGRKKQKLKGRVFAHKR